MKRILTALAVGILALTGARADTLINGAGSTFDYPIFAKWFSAYHNVDPSVSFNYQAIGSGGGLRQILAQTIDFGASDAPLTDRNIAQAPGAILNLPVVAGGVAVVYKIPGNPKLRLDADTLEGIFMGRITKWNDPRVAALNPQAALPDSEISVVHRSDGSGTTFIFTDYLTAISPDWGSKVGKGSTVNWPKGLGANGNQGVAEMVDQEPGTIGYVELAYAKKKQMQYADLRNASGEFVSPTLESVSAALSTAVIPDDFRFSIVNATGAEAYPIAGASWMLVYKAQKSPEKGRKLIEFIRWAVTDGQKLSPSIDYSPIPESLAKRIVARLDDISIAK
jgi:phosphate transport system substrate-binding protein